MRTTLRIGLLALLLLALCTAAVARNVDGTLGLIRQPISTVPTIVLAGDSFTITIAAAAPVTDVRAALYRGTEQVDLPRVMDEKGMTPIGGLVSVKVPVPKDTAAGLYGLSVMARAGTRFDDTAERAVRVYREWPRQYRFAHLTDVHIGKPIAPYAAQVFHRTAQQLNRQGVDFAVITGDLTEYADPQQFRTFISELDTFAMPTFCIPGNHDRGGSGGFGSKSPYEDYCGPANYSFDFGSHRYLGWDTRWEDEFLVYQPYKSWLEKELARPKPSFGMAFSHRISEEEYAWFQERLPASNYQVFFYGHTHDDEMSWIGAKRLLLLNTSHEYAGTYNVLTVEGDQLKRIEHTHVSAVPQ